jgi:hypothetical protein
MPVFRIEVLTSGTVRFTVTDGFYLGELPEGLSERVRQLVAALDGAGIVAQASAIHSVF